MRHAMIHYPFTAIVGQDTMKTALLANAVNPRLGGVLVRGEKGTAKSTAVRALASLLPNISVMDCAFGCDPDSPATMCDACRALLDQGKAPGRQDRQVRVTDLPVGSTEDRVVGTLDIEQAIKKGEKRFEPGILAQANRGILYVDEVNLLDDHIVDVLLDAAAMGVNTVEREGVSYSHPAEFILVGTMNPEEGELRPQLLDRFALCANVRGSLDLEERVEVIRRRAAFESSPEAFAKEWAEEEEVVAAKIEAARTQLPSVHLPDNLLRRIASLSIEMEVDGHRADIVMMKTALTLAALDGRQEATKDDVRFAAELTLPHRMRRKPFQKVGVEAQRLEQAFQA